MELTVVGCSGSPSGPGLARILLPGPGAVPGRSSRLVLDLGPGVLRRALPLSRPGRGRRDRPSATCTPTTASTCAASTSPPRTHRPRPGRRSRLRARRNRAPAGGGLRRPRRACPSRIRASPTHSTTGLAAQPADRTVRASPRVRVAHPVEAYAIRVTEDGRRAASLVFSGDTGPSDGLVDLAAVPTCCWSRRPSSTLPTTRRAASVRSRGRRGSRPGAGSAGWC